MLRNDVAWALDQVGERWSYFANNATPAQRRDVAGMFERFRGDRDQVEAILADAFLGSEKGFPPLAKIKARLEAASAGRTQRASEMNLSEQREWLESRIEVAARTLGLRALLRDDPRTNLNCRSWCRRAKALGLNVAEIAARGVNRPVTQVHEELRRMAAEAAA